MFVRRRSVRRCGVGWYAQDAEGNDWYLGEDSKELKDGQVVSTHGSREACIDRALPMLAAPLGGSRSVAAKDLGGGALKEGHRLSTC